MIELKNVSKYYHSKDVTNLGLHNVSARFDKNEIVAITGDSGSGKSTLLNVITKIDTFDEGEIYYKGNETSYFSVSDMDDFRKNKIGFIFQSYNILDSYTVLENVMLPLTLKGMNVAEAKEKALELIKKVGLSDRVKARGTKLSGGEKQRCVIARALASDCEILACDEPTGNLDSKTGEEIIKLIKEVAQDKLVLIVTHNFDQVKDIVTRKIKVADGEIVEDVKYQTVPEDENEDLELDYVPLKRKICARVAKNNTFFTPRKTILLSIILLVICVSTLFLFQSIFASMNSINYSSVYYNDRSDRYVIYNYDHSEIKSSDLSGLDYDVNTWYEDRAFTFDVKTTHLKDQQAHYSNRYSYDLDSGNVPTLDSEVLLIVGDEYKYWYNDVINEDIIGKSISVYGVEYKISGLAYTKDIDYNFVLSNNESLRKLVTLVQLMNNSSFKCDNQVLSVTNKYIKDSTPKLILPKSYEGKAVSAKAFGIYDMSFVKVEYSNDYDSPTFVYSNNISDDYVPLLEASVYTTNALTVKSLKKLNYGVDECATVTNSSKIMILIANIYAYSTVVFASLLLIIVFFITYLILSRVYASRKKDYEILRTLGVTKSDMKHIVNYEVIGVSLAMIVLSFIIVVILVNFVPQLIKLRNIKPITALIYFAATTLFGVSIARRFNRRLFRFSVTKSMKGDGKHD